MRLRVRVWVRRRWRQLAVTALLIGVAGGLAIGLASGTRRTDSAPDRYTTKAGGDPDLVIQQLSGPPLTAEIAKIAGVARAQSVAFVTSFLVAPDDGSLVLEPNPYAGDDTMLGARVVEGRFTDPDVSDEFTINRVLATLLTERFGARMGDRFQIASFDQQQIVSNRAFNSGEPPAVPRFEATLVGIIETPSDFDNPAPTMVFSQSFLSARPTVGVVQTFIAVALEADANPDAVMDAVHELPNGGDAFAVVSRIVSADARRAVRFQVTALWIVTAIAVLAASVVVLQVIARMLRIDEDERSSLMAIGWRPKHLIVERSIEGGFAALLAAPVAAIVGFALTALFPFGTLRSFEPDSGARMDWMVTLYGVVAITAIVVIGAAFAGRRLLTNESERNPGIVARLVAASGAGMAPATGALLSATGPHGGRRSLTALVGGVIGLAGLVASIVVWLSLTNIVDEPDRWGVNYDQVFGNPYVPAERDIVTPIIGNPDVIAVTGAHIGSLTLNSRDVATLAFDAVKGGLRPTTLEGRPPASNDEVGLGAEVARRLGVGVGDEVDAVGPVGAARPLRVVGIVVTPDSAGNGAAMTFEGYAALSPTATKNVLFVNFRKGAPADAADVVAADNFSPPGALVTPTSVRALQRVTAAPLVLAVVLAVLLTVACAYLLATSVAARSRDLAVLRALGCDRRQVRAIIHWQAMLVTAVVVLVGLPGGLIVGRLVVRLLTTALGIVPGAAAPVLLVLAVPVVAVVMANVLALVPARRAAHTNIARLTRDR